MTHKLVCTIPRSLSSYDINIQSGLLYDPTTLIASIRQLGSRFAIITDKTIALLYGDPLFMALSRSDLETLLLTFPSGETNKTRATKERLEDQLFANGCGRDTCVIALGGGVVTDLAGFVAATYCRGVPLVMIPTSLLGMVDASIGGKTGVDVPFGKNLVGCTYQPRSVWIDPSLLKNLPLNQLRNGIVEMIKHRLIADLPHFDYLDRYADRLLSLDATTLEKSIYDSCLIKKEIVEQDEHESGKRRLLNFGHTVGHALEKLSHYALAHGEAVAIGILVESHLAMQLGHLHQSAFDRILNIFKKYNLPLRLPSRYPIDSILDAMILDKKSVQGHPRFVIINAIGSALPFESQYCTQVEENQIKTALQWMYDALRYD